MPAASYELNILQPDVVPVSAFFITITAVMAVWIATCVTTIYIASGSAISSIILLLLEWLCLPFKAFTPDSL